MQFFDNLTLLEVTFILLAMVSHILHILEMKTKLMPTNIQWNGKLPNKLDVPIIGNFWICL